MFVRMNFIVVIAIVIVVVIIVIIVIVITSRNYSCVFDTSV